MNKLWDKFGDWFGDMNPMKVTILFVLAFALGLCLVKICFITPYPPGIFLNRGGNYQLNSKGIVYTSSPIVPLTFPFTGNADWGFLEDADPESFEVLNHRWAKDRLHVWYENHIVKGADAKTFQLDKTGLPKDKYHVFVWDYNSCKYHPSQCGIDPATAEYFVGDNGRSWYWDNEWIRDSKHVYFDDRRMEVDRKTFRRLTGEWDTSRDAEWFVDKDFVYVKRYPDYDENDSQIDEKPIELVRVDTLRKPLEVIPHFPTWINSNDTLRYASEYLRNGRNIIFQDKVVVRDIDVKSIRIVSDGDILHSSDTCIINDTLRLWYGERVK